eukprot:gene10178-11220_t
MVEESKERNDENVATDADHQEARKTQVHGKPNSKKSKTRYDLYAEPSPLRCAVTTDVSSDAQVMRNADKASKGKTAKPGVNYFVQFPKTFLKPYGPAEAFPEKEIAMKRLPTESCKWFKRPEVAMSELSSTVIDNLNILAQQQVAKKEILALQKQMNEILELLHIHGRMLLQHQPKNRRNRC